MQLQQTFSEHLAANKDKYEALEDDYDRKRRAYEVLRVSEAIAVRIPEPARDIRLFEREMLGEVVDPAILGLVEAARAGTPRDASGIAFSCFRKVLIPPDRFFSEGAKLKWVT